MSMRPELRNSGFNAFLLILAATVGKKLNVFSEYASLFSFRLTQNYLKNHLEGVS